MRFHDPHNLSRRHREPDFDVLTGLEIDFEWRPGICYGKGSGGGTNTVTNNSQPPAQVLAAYQTAINSAQTAASAPLQQYTGATVAGFSPDQLGAFGTIDASQGIQTPYLNNANTAIGNSQTPLWNGVQQFSPSAVNQYMSPYTQQVLQGQEAVEQNQDAQQQTALQGNAISSGAWGGDRAGVASAVLSGQQDIANNATNASILNQGYQTGLSEFNTQQQSQLGANEANSYLNAQAGSLYGALGTEAQNTALTGANAQESAGALQQELGQEELNVPYENFLQSQAYPFQTAAYFANLAEGTGSLEGGTATTTSPAASSLSTDLGLGIGGLGLLGSATSGTDAASGASTSLLGKLFSARGGRIPPKYLRGGVINAARKYDSGGQVYNPAVPFGISGTAPDLDISIVPNEQSGAKGKGPPNAPPAYKAQPTSVPSMSSFQGAGKALGQLFAAGPQSSSLGQLDNLTGGTGQQVAGVAGDSEGLSLIDSPSFLSSFGSDGGTGFRRGGRSRYDDGGNVGGQSPTTASLSGQQMPTASGYVNGMSAQQLQNYLMRLPPGSQSAQQIQQVINQRRMMPNVGQPAQGGLGSQAAPQQQPSAQQAPAIAGGVQSSMPQGAFARGGFADGSDVDTSDGIYLPDPPPAQSQVEADAIAGAPPISPAALGGMGTGSGSGMGDTAPSSPPPSASTYDDALIKKLQDRTPAKADPWMALANAGFAMAAGDSPHAGQNIGAGALAGIRNYQEQSKQANDVNEDANKLLDEAQTHKSQVASEAQNADTNRQRMLNENAYQMGQLKQKQIMKDNFGNVIGVFDPATNSIQPIKGMPGMSSGAPAGGSTQNFDVNGSATGAPQSSPAQVAGGASAAAPAGAMATLPPDMQARLQQVAPNPKDQALITALIQGRIAPNRQALGTNPQAYIAAAADVDPSFDAANPTARMKVAADYSAAGQSGKLITSLNTASRHAAATALAGIDLDNYGGSDSMLPYATTVNEKVNNYERGKGDSRFTDYDSYLGNYGHEAMKVISGKSNPGEAETAAFTAPLSSNGATEQILGALSAKNGMMLSRAQEMQDSYDQSMGQAGMKKQVVSPAAAQAFSDMDLLHQAAVKGTLDTPEAQAAKKRLQVYAKPVIDQQKQMASSGVPPAAQRQAGQSYNTPKGRLIWGEDGQWHQPQAGAP